MKTDQYTDTRLSVCFLLLFKQVKPWKLMLVWVIALQVNKRMVSTFITVCMTGEVRHL